jgi:hypothetical protein
MTTAQRSLKDARDVLLDRFRRNEAQAGREAALPGQLGPLDRGCRSQGRLDGEDRDNTLSMNYVQLIPVLVPAIQQQQAEIATLKAGRARFVPSLLSGGLGEGLALGLVPVGLMFAIRRRKAQQA